jgi:hypothetical protein
VPRSSVANHFCFTFSIAYPARPIPRMCARCSLIACVRVHTHTLVTIPRHANLFLLVFRGRTGCLHASGERWAIPPYTALRSSFVNCNHNFVNWIELRNLRRRCTISQNLMSGTTSTASPDTRRHWSRTAVHTLRILCIHMLCTCNVTMRPIATGR